MSEEPTIFTRIINGELPCHKVYEDDLIIAFLDIQPLTRGHTLVIPKEPAPSIDQLSSDSAAALGRALPVVSRGVLKATGATAYNLVQNNGHEAGMSIAHVHIHIIPRIGVFSTPSILGAPCRTQKARPRYYQSCPKARLD